MVREQDAVPMVSEPAAITTWQGFEAFATTPPPAPPAADAPRRGLDERLAYHSAFVTIRTPAVDALARNVRTLMILGRHQRITARPSLIVTGPATTGRTTALLEVGRVCHLAHTARGPHPGIGHTAQVPSPTSWCRRQRENPRRRVRPLLRHPHHRPDDPSPVHLGRVYRLAQAGVRLVVIDEIHRLNPHTSTGAETADLLKDFSERIGATFVYAGIDVTRTELFTGIRGAQLVGRNSLIDFGAFPTRLGKNQPFKELIALMEQALDLKNHTEGSLARLIRQAALGAIIDGSERITKASLEAIQLDHLAEEHYRPRTNHPTRKRPGR